MVTRLAGQIAHPESVFDDQHTVPVHAPHDRARRTRTKTAKRNARLVFERRTERALDFLREVLAAEHVGGLKRLELAFRFRTDRRHFTEMELGVDPNVRGLQTRFDRDLRPRLQVSIRANRQMIWARRDVRDRELPVGTAPHLLREGG